MTVGSHHAFDAATAMNLSAEQAAQSLMDTFRFALFQKCRASTRKAGELTMETCGEQLSVADGVIVGGWFKQHGEADYPVDPERIKAVMDTVKALRSKA